jgi:uncharacterized protein (DUF1499 family)
MLILKSILIIVVVIVIAALAAGQAGLLKGKPPGQLGVRDGKLRPPSPTPNSVSSQAALYLEPGQRTYASVEPLALRGTGPQTIAKLKAIVESMPGAEVVKSEPDYLYAQYTTRLMKYVDDVEFWYDPAKQVVQVRSARASAAATSASTAPGSTRSGFAWPIPDSGAAARRRSPHSRRIRFEAGCASRRAGARSRHATAFRRQRLARSGRPCTVRSPGLPTRIHQEPSMLSDLPFWTVVAQIIRHTPPYVWAILLALVALGLMQWRDHIVSRARLAHRPDRTRRVLALGHDDGVRRAAGRRRRLAGRHRAGRRRESLAALAARGAGRPPTAASRCAPARGR